MNTKSEKIDNSDDLDIWYAEMVDEVFNQDPKIPCPIYEGLSQEQKDDLHRAGQEMLKILQS